MDYLCQVCDQSLIENPSEYQHYLDTSHKKNDKSFYIKYTISSINLDELDKISNEYITIHNKKFNFYLFIPFQQNYF